jgi:hypothetical protein
MQTGRPGVTPGLFALVELAALPAGSGNLFPEIGPKRQDLRQNVLQQP